MNLGTVSATVLLVVLAGCGDGQTPATEPVLGGGDGGAEEILVSGANRDAWDLNCGGMGHAWDAGVFRVSVTPFGSTCSAASGGCMATTVDRIDLTPYTAARLRFHLKLSLVDSGSRGSAQVIIDVLPNVPGDDMLRAYGRSTALADTFDEDIDISLKNALGFGEATVRLSYSANTGSSQGECSDHALVEISDFRIVGMK